MRAVRDPRGPGDRAGLDSLVQRHRIQHLTFADREPVADALRLARVRQHVGAHRPHGLEDLLPAGHQQSVAGPDSWCTPADGALVTGPGTPITTRPRPPCPARGVQGTAANGGLHHDGSPAQSGDDPVAGQEPDAGRGAARWRLGDHQPHVGDVVDQGAVRGRVGAVGAAGQHRHGPAAVRQRSPVGSLVDAERGTGDDRPRLLREPCRDAGRHLGPVGRGGARAHHGDGLLARLVQSKRAATPQAQGHAAALMEVGRLRQVVEAVGPLVVPGHDEPDPLRCGPLELARRVDCSQPLGEVGAQLRCGRLLVQARQHPRGSQLVDEVGEAGISRFADARERRPRQPFGLVVMRSCRGRPPYARARCSAGAACRRGAGGPHRARRHQDGRLRPGRRPTRRPGAPALLHAGSVSRHRPRCPAGAWPPRSAAHSSRRSGPGACALSRQPCPA